jgi:hypothetical protein
VRPIDNSVPPKCFRSGKFSGEYRSASRNASTELESGMKDSIKECDLTNANHRWIVIVLERDCQASVESR